MYKIIYIRHDVHMLINDTLITILGKMDTHSLQGLIGYISSRCIYNSFRIKQYQNLNITWDCHIILVISAYLVVCLWQDGSRCHSGVANTVRVAQMCS